MNSPAYYIDPNADRPGRINTFSMNLQYQLMKDLLVEAAYVGNRGVWENGPSGLVALNDISQADLTAHGLNLNNPANLSLLTSTLGSARPSRRASPRLYRRIPHQPDRGAEHSPLPAVQQQLQSHVGAARQQLVRLAPGQSHQAPVLWVSAQAAYTFSKEEATGQAINDVFNRPNQKSLVSSSQPNLFTLSFVYQVPLQEFRVAIIPRAEYSQRVAVERSLAVRERLADFRAGLTGEPELADLPVHAYEPGTRTAAVPGRSELP